MWTYVLLLKKEMDWYVSIASQQPKVRAVCYYLYSKTVNKNLMSYIILPHIIMNVCCSTLLNFCVLHVITVLSCAHGGPKDKIKNCQRKQHDSIHHPKICRYIIQTEQYDGEVWKMMSNSRSKLNSPNIFTFDSFCFDNEHTLIILWIEWDLVIV